MAPNEVRRVDIWAQHFRSVFIPQIEVYASCLTKRLLPSFEDLDDQTDRIEQEEYERLYSSWHDDYPDPASLTEQARNKAVDYMLTMRDIRQGLLNLFGAGLYHLFEQQLLLYHRRAILSRTEQNDPRLLKVDSVVKVLAENGIDITSFAPWARLEELQCLANAVKHADGRSAAKLRQKRPDLFCDPYSTKIGFPFVREIIFQPLAGEGIYLNEVEFNRYVEEITAFWSEFGDRLIKSHRHDV